MNKSRYESVKLSPEQSDLKRTADLKADDLFDFADKHLPHSRYFNLFMTSLETAMLYLERAIADAPASTNEEKSHGD
jgi:hypothetical protein